jgi:hypothetical protein
VATKRTPNPEESRAAIGDLAEGTPRLRLKLKTLDDVKAELARLYREGKAGKRDVSDVSKLAHVINLLGRLIVDNELAGRIEVLEAERANMERKP